MATLSELNIKDLRPQLSVLNRPKCRRKRKGSVTSATLHYNGGAVGGFGKPDRELKHVIEIDVPHHQKYLEADSLMYHLVVLSDGQIYQTRDFELQAWHCRHEEGNEHSIAVHLPLGGTQDATAIQWERTTALMLALIDTYNLTGRNAIKGHKEWSETQCPGLPLMNRLLAWRKVTFAGGIFQIRTDIAGANVRQGPGRNFKIAATMSPGNTLVADEIITGETIGNESRWAHRSDGLGFVHMSLVNE